jgi:hypothetical protein
MPPNRSWATLAVVSVFSVLSVATVGCGAGDRCQEAVQHLQSCFPDRAIDAQQALGSCSADDAERVLGQSCQQLAQSRDTKADCLGWWDWSCWWGSKPSKPAKPTLKVTISKCYNDMFGVNCGATSSAGCTKVVLEDATGSVVASATTRTISTVAFEELDPGTYTVRVLRRDDTAAQAVDGDPTNTNPAGSPATTTVTVGEDDATVRFYFSSEENDRLDRCTTVTGGLEAVCQGQVGDPEETEWTWLIELVDSAGETLKITRASRRYQQPNTYYFSKLLPGSYRLKYHEMDIPSYQREANPDYERLLRWYSEGVVLEKSFELTYHADGFDLDKVSFERCDN